MAGHDTDAIDSAIRAAKAAKGSRISSRVEPIAFGSPSFHDSAEAHGAPLGEAEVQATKRALNWPSMEPFWLPDDVVAAYRIAGPQGERAEALWRDQLTSYEQTYREEARELRRVLSGKLPGNWTTALPRFGPGDKPMATRVASGRVLESLAPVIPELVGGSADLAPSTRTYLSGFGDFSRESPQGRNYHFGVREHGMGAILNGMALYGGLRPYGSTFLVFSDYMRPSVRLAALMGLPVIYVWTHDSIFVGEDGPTHEPIEQLMSLRLIPDFTVIRPADANETAAHGKSLWSATAARQPWCCHGRTFNAGRDCGQGTGGCGTWRLCTQRVASRPRRHHSDCHGL